ncbi:MAG: GerAB/ArcD/ProY family transporter [Roseburia sp.]|nr:GerAB/ArcD/ProY family transporter [Roseburia sp.]
MFSENNKISGRQTFRLLTYDLLGLSTLLVPTVLGRTAARDGIFAIAIGVGAAWLYLKVLKSLAPGMGGSYAQYLEQRLGKAGGALIQTGYLLYFVLLAGYTAYLFADVVLQELLREESFYLVLLILLLLAAYGLWGGIEGRARIYEMLFWFLLIPLFLMLFSAVDGVQTDYWTPVFSADFAGIAEGSYYVFLCLSVIFLSLFLGEYVEKKESIFRAASGALLLVGGIHAVLYLILLGSFGADALGTMDYPAVTLMSTVQITGGFLKRTDAFMFGIWFFTLYALLNSCCFYGSSLLSGILGGVMPKTEEKARKRWAMGAVLVAVFAVSCCFYKSRACFVWYEWFLWHIATPFVVIVPLILAIGRRQKRVLALALCLAAPCLVCAGCATAELEDRNFPIELAVENTDAIGTAFGEAEGDGNRVLDYSHLKVMVIHRDIVENKEAMQKLLDLLEEKRELPRNTYIVAADDPEKILALSDGLGESVGNYLEEQFENVSQIKKQAYPTLGTLYQERINQTETLYIPYVDDEDGKPVVRQYYVLKRGEPAGTVGGDAAVLAFFTDNRMEEYQLSLSDGTQVSLSSPHNEIAFRERAGQREIVVQVHCSGELFGTQQNAASNRRNTAGQEQIAQEHARIEQAVASYMNTLAGQTLSEQGIDLSGSYRRLGGAARGWYQEYQKKSARYEGDMRIVYEVDIDWVNL